MGEAAGLVAALCWALGSLLFSRVALPAAAINLFKNTISAAALVIATLGFARAFHADLVALGWLAASAAIGLVIGDTCHFRAIQVLGPRRSVVLEAAAPLLGAVLGWWVLAERLGPVALVGIAVSLAGIVLVIRERAPAVGNLDASASPAFGVWMGLSAAACQATGAALSKLGIRRIEALAGTPASAALEAAALRLVVAAAVGFALAVATRRLVPWYRAARARDARRILFPASFIGTCLGVWFSMVAFQRTEIGVATTLTAFSPVFILPLVAVFLKERISRRAILGAALAVAGVAILASRA